MATQKLYEPTARYYHASCSVSSGVIVRGGRTHDFESGSKDARIKLANIIELFDPYLEVWCQLNTTGTPHPGLSSSACASVADQVYMYGGHIGKSTKGVLSYFDMKKLTWSQLCPEATAGAPMRKFGCGLIIVHENLVVVGGFGYPTGLPKSEELLSRAPSSVTVVDGRTRSTTLTSIKVVIYLCSLNMAHIDV